MPIIKSAKKAMRTSANRRVFNLRRQRAMRAAIKGVSDATSLSAAYQAIDKAQKRGVIKANTAARKKSRLAKRLTQTTSRS